MTTQALARSQELRAQREALRWRWRPSSASLLAIPGLVPLSLGNGLTQGFTSRLQATVIAWLLLDMGASNLWLGVVNGLPAIAIVVFSLLAGVLADSHDSRRLLLQTRLGLASVAFLAAALTSAGAIQPPLLLAIVLASSALAAIDMPVARTRILEVVGAQRLLAGTAATSMAVYLIHVVVPLALGGLIGQFGVGAALYAIALAYGGATLLTLATRSGETNAAAKRSPSLADLVAGWRYVRRTPAVTALVGLAFLVPFAGVYFAMIPVYARNVLEIGPGGLGLYMAVSGVGSIAAAAYLMTGRRVGRPGLTLATVSVVFGIGMALFAISRDATTSMAIGFLMGALAVLWQNYLNASLQTAAAPQMRGRVMSFYTMGLQLINVGWLLAGALSAALGPTAAIVIAGAAFGGLAALIFALSKEARQIG